jgi:hypothetical protein
LNLPWGNLIYALEIANDDGPRTVPEANKKYNGFLRYSEGSPDNQWLVSASAYEASWDATNQVKSRAISEGLTNDFWSRTPPTAETGGAKAFGQPGPRKAGDGEGETDVSAYVTVSHMHLWNDLTYFLYNPVR